VSLLDQIHISHIGDVLEDKPLVISKLLAQDKWNRRIYEKKDTTDLPTDPWGFGVAYNNRRYFDVLFEKIFSEYQRIFSDDREIDEVITRKESYCLMQTDERTGIGWHDHNPSYGASMNKVNPSLPLISAVYYLSLPEGSGGIKFKNDTEEIKVMPSEGDLIFFPHTMLHKPARCSCKENRISFNINIFPKVSYA
tara:strand:+ start:213 stop:797 length:585 start_codon:yes stop_codon:yes gene_type:complete